MGTCCEYNRNNIDDGNLGGKIQYPTQITRENRIKSQNKDINNTNSINGNLSGILDFQQTNNETGKKDKNKRPNFISTKEDCENFSSNISLDDTESGEHKLRKKNVSWKTEEFLVEKIEYDPMNAPFEI